MIKSPSDTTLYVPTLCKLNTDEGSTINKDEIIERISNFVEEIRIETANDSGGGGTPMQRLINPGKQMENSLNQQEQQVRPPEQREREADKLSIQAEQYNVMLEAPQGINLINNASG